MKFNFIPLISIIIPTFNHARFLSKALESVINQTYKNWEVLVIDNYSTDSTKLVIEKYSDPRISYIKFRNNGIIAKSRNLGILKSKGEWIAFLDSDDWWKSDKLKSCIDLCNSKTDLIYHDLEIRFENKKNIYRKTFRSRKLKKPIFFDLLVNGNAIANSSVIVRKDLIKKVGMINESKSVVAAEDYNTWLKISKLSEQFIYLPKKLGYYFIHNKSTSKKNMSIPLRKATDEFLNDLNDKQKKKLESNIRYLSGRYNYLNFNYDMAKRDLKFTLYHGLFSLKLKSFFMMLIMIFK